MRAIHAAVLAFLALAGDSGAAQTAQAPLPADTPGTTVAGATFIAPAGWSVTVKGSATIVEAPEGDSRIALVDVTRQRRRRGRGGSVGRVPPGREVAAEVARSPSADKDGWQDQRTYVYRTSPERAARRRGGRRCATASLDRVDLRHVAADRREARRAGGADLRARCCPKGYERETLRRAQGAHARRGADRRARRVRRARAAGARRARRVDRPGRRTARWCSPAASACASWAGPTPVDADTLYIIASNTKALTTLMLAKLVDEGKLDLGHAGDAACCRSSSSATPTPRARVLVKHLVCACTGLPRQDFEWLLEFETATPGRRARRARHHAADQQVRRDVPVLEPAGRGGRVRRRPRAVPESSSWAPPTTRRCRPQRVRAAGNERPRRSTSRARSRGNHAAPHAPDIDGKPATRRRWT